MIYFQRVAELLQERYEKPYNEIMKRREMRVRTMETKKGSAAKRPSLSFCMDINPDVANPKSEAKRS